MYSGQAGRIHSGDSLPSRTLVATLAFLRTAFPSLTDTVSGLREASLAPLPLTYLLLYCCVRVRHQRAVDTGGADGKKGLERLGSAPRSPAGNDNCAASGSEGICIFNVPRAASDHATLPR